MAEKLKIIPLAGPGEVTDYASVFEDRDLKDLHVKGE